MITVPGPMGAAGRLRLHTLGMVDILGPGCEGAARVLSQPKRAALLSYLALARPGGFHRRDTLLNLFWPHLDTAHARGALNQALRFLRRALHRNTIVSRGSEEVGVQPRGLWCDAVAFRAAVDQGRFQQALDLYAGPLLDGFFVRDAPAFEDWLEAERRELRRAAEKAAWGVADREAARGRTVEAGIAALRAAEARPHDESVHQRLLEFLAGLGDRSGALRAHEAFCRRLARDLDIEPTAETRELVDRIRGPGGARDGHRPEDRPRPTPPGPPGPRSGAVVSLMIRDLSALDEDPAHCAFARGLSEDLRATLAASGAVNLVARDLSTTPAPANGGPPLPASLLVLSGSVRLLDARARVVTRLHRVPDLVVLWTGSFDTRVADTLSTQRALAREIGASVAAVVGDSD